MELDDVAGRAPPRTGTLDDERNVARRRLDNHADRRELIRRLHRCGPRPVGELLLEIIARYPRLGPFVDERLAVLAGLDPAWVRWTGADDWLDERDLIRVVTEGRS